MRLLVLAFCAACGSVDGKKVDAAVASDSSPTSDVGIDGPSGPCDVTKPFGTPTPVPGVNTNSFDFHGWLSVDELTIYFTSSATSSSDLNIYRGTRAQPSGAFSGVTLLGGVNTTALEARPVTTADGLTLFAETDATGAGDIYVASRTNTAADFSALSIVGVINSTTAYDGNPWISEDGLVMYFNSTRAGTYDLWRTTRPSTTAAFSAPVAVGELNGADEELTPVLSRDGREIFFGRRAGAYEIFHATRSTTTDGFGTPTAIAELNGTSAEYPGWLSADRCRLIFSSDRSGGSGGYDLWIATRPQ